MKNNFRLLKTIDFSSEMLCWIPLKAANFGVALIFPVRSSNMTLLRAQIVSAWQVKKEPLILMERKAKFIVKFNEALVNNVLSVVDATYCYS